MKHAAVFNEENEEEVGDEGTNEFHRSIQQMEQKMCQNQIVMPMNKQIQN